MKAPAIVTALQSSPLPTRQAPYCGRAVSITPADTSRRSSGTLGAGGTAAVTP